MGFFEAHARLCPLPLPVRLPARPARPLARRPRILDRDAVPVLLPPEDALLLHREPEEPAAVAGAGAELLAGLAHRVPHPLELELAGGAPVRLVQLPGAVDRPVAQMARPAEAERSWGEGVVEEVSDQSWRGQSASVSQSLTFSPGFRAHGGNRVEGRNDEGSRNDAGTLKKRSITY